MLRIILPLAAVLVLAACAPSTPATEDAIIMPAQTTGNDTTTATAEAPQVANDVLPKYHWQLADATAADGQRIQGLFARADKPLQLDFNAGTVATSNGCNRMRAPYTLDGDALHVGALAATMMACGDTALMAMDAATGKYLQGDLAISLDTRDAEPSLTLMTDAGDTLAFRGAPTAETRYGGESETVFLEIAPQDVLCNHPLAPEQQCPRARELTYDANGLRQGEPGEWSILATPIEGYTHVNGIRNVLRVKRFHVANPPADASSTAYVLDMVVESEDTTIE